MVSKLTRGHTHKILCPLNMSAQHALANANAQQQPPLGRCLSHAYYLPIPAVFEEISLGVTFSCVFQLHFAPSTGPALGVGNHGVDRQTS